MPPRKRDQLSPPSAIANSNDPKRLKTSESETVREADQKTAGKGLDLSQPPLSDINDIFFRMTNKALHNGAKGDETTLDDVTKRLGNRAIRVATLCSGTESPILALKLIEQSLVRAGKRAIRFQHLFSAEIEPYKQAYIQRNFSPPLLFQNIVEFDIHEDEHSGKRSMTGLTAYGATENVPLNVEILIAGSSCVELSKLNQNPVRESWKEAQGKSKETFEAVWRYVDCARPLILVFENVESDSKIWDEMERRYQDLRYATKVLIVDTKDYYIPHTRKRGYMLCLNEDVYSRDGDAKALLECWAANMRKLEGRPSAPVSSFLLPADDPRVLSLVAWDEKRDTNFFKTDEKWEAARELHKNFRPNNNLGSGRPISSPHQCPEHGHHKWLKTIPSREREVIDIRHLLQASVYDQDSLFKTRTMDISQAVDRIDRNPLGVAGCVTPKGKSYVTDAVRPLNGYEALMLQGIPIEEVSFTTESNANLKDLAGNAMTSTVVGSALLSALLVGFKGLESGPSDPVLAPRRGLMGREEDSLGVARSREPASLKIDWMTLLAEAESSARKCYCEGSSFVSKQNIAKCADCSQSICTQCKGSPKHSYDIVQSYTRLSRRPDSFLGRWSSQFPLRLRLGRSMNLHTAQRQAFTQMFGDEKASELCLHLQNAFQETFTFHRIRREEVWTVSYRSFSAKLELVLSDSPEWRIVVSPPENLAADLKLQRVLRYPVARARVETQQSLDSPMEWEAHVPSDTTVEISISSCGTRVPSWRAELGLDNFSHEEVPKTLEVVLQPEPSLFWDQAQGITGRYTLLPDCGTAFRSLYKRDCAAKSTDSEVDVFLFLDPDPLGEPSADRFVFSHNCRRLDHGQYRESIASIPSWRPWKHPQTETWKELVEFRGSWNSLGRFSLITGDVDIEFRSLDSSGSQKEIAGQICAKAPMLLNATINMRDFIASDFAGTRWACTDSISLNDKSFFETFSSVFKQINLSHLDEWTDITGVTDLFQPVRCIECSPEPPITNWARNSKSEMVANRKYLDAAVFESQMNKRPKPFAIGVEVINDAASKVLIRVSANVRQLAHRAIAHLLSISPDSIPSVRWRLITDHVQPAAISLPNFRNSLSGNDEDEPHPSINGLQLGEKGLHDEQSKSLSWMKKQERQGGVPFTLEHYEEATLQHIGWRLEVEAKLRIFIKGGVLADAPSYGKTITTLALIHEEFNRHNTPEDIIKDFQRPKTSLIPTAATLIVTPGHLLTQWHEEITTKLPEYNKLNRVIKIKDLTQLNKNSIKKFQEARIVLVCSELLERPSYLGALAELAGLSPPRTSDQSLWLEHALEKVKESVAEIRDKSISDFVEGIIQARTSNDNALALMPQDLVQKPKKQPSAKEPTAKKPVKKKPTPKKPKATKKVETRSPAEKRNDAVRTRFKNVEKKTDKDGTSYQSLSCPIFHMFRWNRLVVDEFALTTNHVSLVYTSIVGLEAEKRWILSGTPPLDDFHDIKLMAQLIGVNLGIDSFRPGIMSDAKVRNYQGQLTNAEKFLGFQEQKSLHWHLTRHRYAKEFLQTFVRQNQVDLSEIPARCSLHPVDLKASHRAVYKELEFYLDSVGARMRPATRHRPLLEDTASPEGEQSNFRDEPPTSEGEAEAEEPPTATAESSAATIARPDARSESATIENKAEVDVRPAVKGSQKKKDKPTDKAASSTAENSDPHESILVGPKTIEHALLRASSVFPTTLRDLQASRERQMENLKGDITKALADADSLSEQWYAQESEKEKTAGTAKATDAAAKLGTQRTGRRKPGAPEMQVDQPPADVDFSQSQQPQLSFFGKWKNEHTGDRDTNSSIKELIGNISGMEVVGHEVRSSDAPTGDADNHEEEKQDGHEVSERDDGSEEGDAEIDGAESDDAQSDDAQSDDAQSDVAESDEARSEDSHSAKSEESEPEEDEAENDGNDGPPKKQDTLDKRLEKKVLKLRGLTREMISRFRSLRYIRSVRTVLEDPEMDNAGSGIHCEATSCLHGHEQAVNLDEARILSPCGHIICAPCLEDQEMKFTCVVDECDAEINSAQVQKRDDFGKEQLSKETSFGSKLDEIVDILKTIDPSDQAVLFVQDGYVADKVEACLNRHKISNAVLANAVGKTMKDLTETAASAANTVESFKAKPKDKLFEFQVLVICLDSEHVTGLNLENANHVFFLAPYHAADQYQYETIMLQSIRRCHRTGQKKDVKVYRFVALNTIDVNVLQDRERKLVEPLWQGPKSAENTINSAKPDPRTEEGESQLVEIDTGSGRRFALAPEKWLRDGKFDVKGIHSTKVALSSCYDHFDEHYDHFDEHYDLGNPLEEQELD